MEGAVIIQDTSYASVQLNNYKKKIIIIIRKKKEKEEVKKHIEFEFKMYIPVLRGHGTIFQCVMEQFYIFMNHDASLALESATT